MLFSTEQLITYSLWQGAQGGEGGGFPGGGGEGAGVQPGVVLGPGLLTWGHNCCLAEAGNDSPPESHWD